MIPAQLVESPEVNWRRGGGHTGDPDCGRRCGTAGQCLCLATAAHVGVAPAATETDPATADVLAASTNTTTDTRPTCTRCCMSGPSVPPLRHATALQARVPRGVGLNPARALEPQAGPRGPCGAAKDPYRSVTSSCRHRLFGWLPVVRPLGASGASCRACTFAYRPARPRSSRARRPVGDAPRRSGMCSRVDPLMRDSPGAVRALRAAARAQAPSNSNPRSGALKMERNTRPSAAAIAAAVPRGRPRPRGVPARPCLDHRVGRLEQ